MIRKWMTILFSLLLAVMLPVAALADTQYTLTVLPGDELASMPLVKDLTDVVSLTFTEGEKSFGMTATIADKDIVTIALGADVAGLYAQSELLGGNVFHVGWDEGFAFLREIMKATMQEQGAATDEMMNGIDTYLANVKDSIIVSLKAEENGQDMSAYHSLMDAKKLAQEMYADNPEMLELIMVVYDDMTEETGEFADPARDTADTKTSCVLDTEDMIAIMDSAYMRKMMEQSISGMSTQPGEEVPTVDDLIAEVKEIFENGEYTMTMDAYSADGGKTLVGMDMNMVMNITEPVEEREPETVSMTMDLNYDRLTGETGISHKGNFVVAVEDDPMTIVFDVNCGNDGTDDGFAAMLVGGTQMSAVYSAQPTGKDASESLLSLYMRNGATAPVAPAASERPLLGFKVVTKEADPALLSAIDAANADNSVNVLALSEEEMGTLMEEISGNAMSIAFGALEKLPTSVVNALMGTAE